VFLIIKNKKYDIQCLRRQSKKEGKQSSDNSRRMYRNVLCRGYVVRYDGNFIRLLKKSMRKLLYAVKGTPEEIKAKTRLEYLRGEIKKECISYGEIAELQSLAKYIEPSDVLLLNWAGVEEFTK